MLQLELSWPDATVSAGCLAAATVGLRQAARPRRTQTSTASEPGRTIAAGPAKPGLARAATLTQETALIVALFALWEFAGSFSVVGPSGALTRASWLWHLERAAHLPSETSLQAMSLPHPLLVQAFNLYYAVLHFPVLIGCMIWLFIWHNEQYQRLRTTLVVFTGGSLLIQLIPVAPPRMLPGTGMVDTAVLYGQSVYATHTGFDADQLSAMPSVHVGWAILVAVAVIGAGAGRWRWLVLLYPVLTTVAVVVTANHFWLDAIVAALLLAAVRLTQAAVRRIVPAQVNSGLLLPSWTWHHPRNGDPAGTGGSNGRIDSRDQPGNDRAAAGRHRPA